MVVKRFGVIDEFDEARRLVWTGKQSLLQLVWNFKHWSLLAERVAGYDLTKFSGRFGKRQNRAARGFTLAPFIFEQALLGQQRAFTCSIREIARNKRAAPLMRLLANKEFFFYFPSD